MAVEAVAAVAVEQREARQAAEVLRALVVQPGVLPRARQGLASQAPPQVLECRGVLDRATRLSRPILAPARATLASRRARERSDRTAWARLGLHLRWVAVTLAHLIRSVALPRAAVIQLRPRLALRALWYRSGDKGEACGLGEHRVHGGPVDLVFCDF